jgi:hypothetical protein
VTAIFFVAYEDANVRGIAPVIHALQARGSWDPVFVPGLDFKAHRGIAAATAPADTRVLRLFDPHLVDPHPADLDRLQPAGELIARLSAASDAHARVAAVAIARFWAAPHRPAIQAAYAQVVNALAEFARTHRPALVVVPEDTDYLRGRVAARVLGAAGAAVVCLVPWYYAAIRSYPLLGARRAAAYLVPTAGYRDRLIAAGVAADRVAVVGDPSLDALTAAPSAPLQPPAVLHALQGLAWEREIAADLLEIVRDNPPARLWIRPHPVLPAPAWLADLRRADDAVTIDRSADARASLHACTVLVAQTSRMLYEASLVGRPVVAVQYDGLPLALDLPVGDCPHVCAATLSALRRCVERALAGGGRGLTRTAIAPYHPRATERVVHCLDQLRDALARGRAAPLSDGGGTR